MINLEMTPYERSILDTAITDYIIRVNRFVESHEDPPIFSVSLYDENIKILEGIQKRLYENKNKI